MPGNSSGADGAPLEEGRRPRAPAARTASASRAAAGPCPPTSAPGTRAYSGDEELPARPPGSRTRSAGPPRPRAARPRSACRAPRRRPASRPGARKAARRVARAAVAGTARRAQRYPRRWQAGPRVAPGRRRPPPRGRAGAAGRAQPGGRGAAHPRAGDRAVRRAGHRASTSGSTRPSGPPATAASPILEVSRAELDRMTGGVLHQGVGLQVPPFAYEPFDDLLAPAAGAGRAAAGRPGRDDRPAQPGRGGPLGGGVRRAGRVPPGAPRRRHDRDRLAHSGRRGRPAADRPGDQPDPGAEGVPGGRLHGRRAWTPTASASLYDLEAAVGPLVVVVGSEGRGLSRLVGETCDLRVASRSSSDVESLNASVAAAVALAEVARRRSTPQ